jgi:hypothetical protein
MLPRMLVRGTIPRLEYHLSPSPTKKMMLGERIVLITGRTAGNMAKLLILWLCT